MGDMHACLVKYAFYLMEETLALNYLYLSHNF